MDQRERASDAVFARLRDGIVHGWLPAGSDHSIYELAERFGVSRTPVREAVLRLAELGMVEMRRNRGFRIKGLSADEVRAIFEFRALLEVPAARRAAERVGPERVAALEAALAAMRAAVDADDVPAFDRADRELHGVILDALENARVRTAVESLRDATQAMGASTFNRERRLAEIEREHEPIVAAILAGDAVAAETRMREHLARTEELLVRGAATA